MSQNDYPLLTDDYVAGLLSQEASDCSTKYSALGLEAYKSDKRPQNQPKPNTRFLNNIIRDTNSHNRALLAKESAESQARLREFERAEQNKQREQERAARRSRPGAADTRKRMLGDIAAFIDPSAKSRSGSAKRRRGDDGDKEDRSEKHSRHHTSSSSRSRHSRDDRRERDEDLFQEDSKSQRSSGCLRLNHSDEERESKRRHRRHHERSKERAHARKDRSSKHESERRRHHRRSSRSRSPREKSRRSTAEKSTRERSPSPGSESDPLDDLIGPSPAPKDQPVRSRGRGAAASSSGIDSRFAADYDPSLDVGPEPDIGKPDSDWDSNVEAFRDRQKWKQQGAERLRAAGFTEDFIKHWETGDKKDETDVQWTKRGAVREWDRGKVVDDDGDVAQEPEWGRLKGT